MRSSRASASASSPATVGANLVFALPIRLFALLLLLLYAVPRVLAAPMDKTPLYTYDLTPTLAYDIDTFSKQRKKTS